MDEPKQAEDGSATPAAETPRSKKQKGGKGEDAAKDVPVVAAEMEAGERSTQGPEVSSSSKSMKPAARMRFRRSRR